MKEEELRKWLVKHFTERTLATQIPSHLRMARKQVEFGSEERAEIMRHYFSHPADTKDLAKRWWKLVKEKALPIQDLAEELDRLREEVGNDKEWKTVIRRTSGNGGEQSAISETGLDWGVVRDPLHLARVGKLFQTIGLRTPSKLEDELARAFDASRDGGRSRKALEELKKSRLATKEKWKEWNTMIRSRFKEDQPEEASPVKLTVKELVEVFRRVKEGGSWNQEVEDLDLKIAWECRVASREGTSVRLRQSKPRLKAPRRLWVEVVTNRPVEDAITDEWKLMKIEVGPKYTLQEIHHKVRTRWKDRWKVTWAEEEMGL
jgi:hypothetical protein